MLFCFFVCFFDGFFVCNIYLLWVFNFTMLSSMKNIALKCYSKFSFKFFSFYCYPGLIMARQKVYELYQSLVNGCGKD